MQDTRGFDTCQAHVEALIRDGEALVVDAEEMQHCRVQVADVNRVLGRVVAQHAEEQRPDDDRARREEAAQHPAQERERVGDRLVVEEKRWTLCSTLARRMLATLATSAKAKGARTMLGIGCMGCYLVERRGDRNV